jgi:hypothetical protein
MACAAVGIHASGPRMRWAVASPMCSTKSAEEQPSGGTPSLAKGSEKVATSEATMLSAASKGEAGRRRLGGGGWAAEAGRRRLGGGGWAAEAGRRRLGGGGWAARGGRRRTHQRRRRHRGAERRAVDRCDDWLWKVDDGLEDLLVAVPQVDDQVARQHRLHHVAEVDAGRIVFALTRHDYAGHIAAPPRLLEAVEEPLHHRLRPRVELLLVGERDGHDAICAQARLQRHLRRVQSG